MESQLRELLKHIQDSSSSDSDEEPASALLGLLSQEDPVARLLASLAAMKQLGEALEGEVGGIRIGDMVRLNADEAAVKRIQDGHGGWNPDMANDLGKVGSVIKTMGIGEDIIVHFGKKTWRLNQEACDKLEKEVLKNMFSFDDRIYVEFTDKIAKEMQKRHGGWDPLMETDLQKVGRVVGTDDDGDVAVQFWTRTWRMNGAACKILNLETGCSFKVGDKVFMDTEVDVGALKVLLEDHKAWSASIVRQLGRIGEVVEINKDGDLVVKIGEKKWTLTPHVCTKIHSMMLPGGDFFCIGDTVSIGLPAEVVKDMQKGHGDWNDQMEKEIGKCGKVTHILANGDLQVNFGANKWRLNAAVCTRHGQNRGPPFKVGQRVTVDLKQEEFLKLQIGHGGINVSMLTDIGKVGKIVEIYEDRDVMIQFSPNMWFLNPAICTKLSAIPKPTFAEGDRVYIGLDPDIVKMLQEGHGGFVDTIFRLMGQVGRVMKLMPTGDIVVLYGILPMVVNPAIVSSIVPVNIEGLTTDPVNMNPFSPGDLVRVDMDTDRVKTLQDGHGGWNSDMKQILGKVGVVDKVDSDGDVQVCFGDKSACLNPAVCTMIRSDQVQDNNTYSVISADQGQNQGAAASASLDDGRASRDDDMKCKVCKTRAIAVVFGCGHGACDECNKRLVHCHECKGAISYRTKVFT